MPKRKLTKGAQKVTAQILKEQAKAFKKKFGREIGPGDPVFFDPNADEPQPIPEEVIKAETLEAMRKSGFPPQFVYAYEKTGFLVGEEGYKNMTPEDRREYDAAIDEYFRLEDQAKKSKS